MPRPTGSGVLVLLVAAAAGGAGVVLGRVVPVALALAVIAVVALAASAVVVGPETGGRRLVASRLADGARAAAVAEVTVRRRRWWIPPSVTVTDRVEGEPVVIAPSTDRAPSGVQQCVYDLPVLPRGRYRVGPISVERTDPCGLARSRRTIAGMQTLWVHPRVHVLPAPRWPGGTDGAGVIRGDGPVLDRLREHEPDGDVRLIHWPSTARRGSAVARLADTAVSTGLVVVLDVTADAYDRPAAFEDAVRVVASVADAGRRHGHPTQLWTTAGTRTFVSSGDAGRLRLLDDLATVATRPGPGLRSLAPVRTAAGGLLVVVTGGGHDPVAALRPLTARFAAAVVVVIGPGPDDTAGPRAGVGHVAAATSADLAARWAGGGWP